MANDPRLNIILSLKDEMSRGLGKSGKSLQKFGKTAAAVGAALVGAGVAAGGLAVIGLKAASDLEESMNAVEVVFKDAARSIEAFGRTSATSVGLSTAAFNELATVTGAMLKNVGFNMQLAANETINLTKRAADMASVFNTDVSQALGAINAALRGEIDPIERFGVSMNAAKVEAKALELGLADTKKEISDTDKQVARLALIFEQTADVEGDFANTSDGLANQLRILKSEFTNMSATLGSVLMPAVTDMLVNLRPAVDLFKEWVTEGASLDDIFTDLAGKSNRLTDVTDFFTDLNREIINFHLSTQNLVAEGFNRFLLPSINKLGQALGGELIPPIEKVTLLLEEFSLAEKAATREAERLQKAANTTFGGVDLDLLLGQIKIVNSALDDVVAHKPLEGLEPELQPMMDVIGEAIPTMKSFNAVLFDMSDPADRAAAGIAKFAESIRQMDIANQLQDPLTELQRALVDNALASFKLEEEVGKLDEALLFAAEHGLEDYIRQLSKGIITMQQFLNTAKLFDPLSLPGGLGPPGSEGLGRGRGPSGIPFTNVTAAPGALIAELAALIRAGQIEPGGARLIDEGRFGVGLEFNATVNLDGIAIGSAQGHAVQDAG